jgi:DnaJ-class molecular chaperone
MIKQIEVTCYVCEGCGKEAGPHGLTKTPCRYCNGKGFVVREEWVKEKNDE